MSSTTPLFLLSGPTASGKTTVAHLLAERRGLRLLSVDSMMVYRGMDIGTAKPPPEELRRFDYAGVNLTEPGCVFSTGKWLRAVSGQLDDRPTLAVGGTGLYFRALIDGLAPEDSRLSTAAPTGVPELRERIRLLDPTVLENLADPLNPRRLERALAWLEAGKPPPDAWRDRAAFPVPVLRWSTEDLNQRIARRAGTMFDQGLLEETRALTEKGLLTGTAAQAIGYREAGQVLKGELEPPAALTRLTVRTRRYAKRQRTWFRNQMDARWVDVENERNLHLAADKIDAVWQETGPFLFERDRHV